jgi:modification methylase
MSAYASSDWPADVPLSALVNKVHCVDALELLARLPDNSVDCVVTSPPYNLRNSTGNGLKGKNDKSLWSNQPMRYGYETHIDDMPHDEYVAWQRKILDECLRVIKSTGAIFYNHKWRVQGGLLQDRADIVSGLPVRQIIIWDRGGGFNFNATYLVPMYEVIYLITKSDFRLAKGGNGYGDVWRIQITGAKLVLDPFGGIGTTARAAIDEGIDYITCDTAPHYCAIAERRLALPYTPNMFTSIPDMLQAVSP